MALDKTSYHDLERRFREQVKRDQENAMERLFQGRGVYLPCREPENQVDYVIVGMEPSFAWAGSVEEGEKKIAEGGGISIGQITRRRRCGSSGGR